MQENNQMPQDQVFWYLKNENPERLEGIIKTDVVIIGGGMAGLSAAQSFHDRGCSVALLEKNYCGAGASGKSSGFITPDSEFNLSHFNRLFGPQEAKRLWDFVLSGVGLIEKNIKKFSLDCDYQVQDTLVVANSMDTVETLQTDYETHQKLVGDGSFYDKESLGKIIRSPGYFGGMSYSNTFGISAYRYCQGMKDTLQAAGVKIFEETPAVSIHADGVDTPHGKAQAEHVVVCVDRFAPDQDWLVNDIYHAQTFLMMSAPLSPESIKKIFPEKPFMVWDTDLIYQYYRITGDNRFMIGGSDIVSIFWGQEQHNSHKIFKKLTRYTKEKFPDVTIDFEYFWPGLIGVSKDIMPIADYSRTMPNVYYISGAAGLPWAAALGHYSAEKIIEKRDNLDRYFSRNRIFPVGNLAQSILRKRLAFALSNLITLYK